QGVHHRARRDGEGLDDEGADHQREQDGDGDRLRVLADDGLATARGGDALGRHLLGLVDVPLADVHQLLSTVRNASWGTSTRPTCFMRFLPSFCFSSSLRLRVMSPPSHLAVTVLPMAFTVSRAMPRLPL